MRRRGGGGVALGYKETFDITISLLFSLETTTKITPWSPGYTSEFRQRFTSGKRLPLIDQNMKDGVFPQLAPTFAID